VQRQQGSDLEKLLAAVREAVLIDHGIQAHAIALVRSGTIPKTTNWKLSRAIRILRRRVKAKHRCQGSPGWSFLRCSPTSGRAWPNPIFAPESPAC
jgi:hypothetical protein